VTQQQQQQQDDYYYQFIIQPHEEASIMIGLDIISTVPPSSGGPGCITLKPH
jgi:hypothetical protein